MSQVEVARRIGSGRHAVLALERGEGSAKTLQAVSKVVNFRVTGLAGGERLADQLLAARAQRRWTQEKLAAMAGISVPTLRSVERGGGSVRSLQAVLDILAPAARSNAVFRAHYQIKDDVRLTPPEFFGPIEQAFGGISLDVAGHPNSFVPADRAIYEDEDGLATAWSGRLAWCNPPFSRLSTWITRCADAWQNQEVEAMLALFPARVETVAFRTRVLRVADVLMLPRRLRFYDAERRQLAASPFALILCAWGLPRTQVLNYAEATQSFAIWADTAHDEARHSDALVGPHIPLLTSDTSSGACGALI